MKLNAGESSIQTSLFSGTCYLTPLLGAWLADGYWGRYKTIMVFSIVYAGVRLASLHAAMTALASQDTHAACTFHCAIVSLLRRLFT